MHDGHRLGGLSLVGAPTDAGLCVPGTALGPAALRAAGISDLLRCSGLQVHDRGDVQLPARHPCTADSSRLPAVASCCRKVAEAVRDVLNSGDLPLLLGGDHAASVGAIAAVAEHCRQRGRPLSLLWLDAHADCNTPESSPSGNHHGMPMAIATGHGPAELLRLSRSTPMVAPGRVALFGLRAVDPGERALLQDSGIRVFDMAAIRRDGIRHTLAAALAHLRLPGAHLHISFDLDLLESLIAPGVSVPEPGGLLTDEAFELFSMIGGAATVGSFDLMELNPLRDRKGMTARLASELTAVLFQHAAAHRMSAAPSAGGVAWRE